MTTRPRAAFALALLAIAATAAGCAGVAPAAVLDGMDAETDDAIDDAIESSSALLADERRPRAVRLAAAKVLGRLRRPAPRAVAALRGALHDTSAPPALRGAAAWALGEMRDHRSLTALIEALALPIDAGAGEQLLAAIAKHHALLSRDEDRMVALVRELTVFSANQGGRASGIYELLGAKMRTLAVNTRVLADALGAAKSPARSAGHSAAYLAAYLAAFELLDGIDRSRSEISADEASWRRSLGEAVREARASMDLSDPRTELLALWYLGLLSDLDLVGAPAAESLFGPDGDAARRPSRSPAVATRFVATWALARMMLRSPAARRALAADVLGAETHEQVLDLVGDFSSRPEDHDLVQKVLGVEPDGAKP